MITPSRKAILPLPASEETIWRWLLPAMARSISTFAVPSSESIPAASFRNDLALRPLSVSVDLIVGTAGVESTTMVALPVPS